MVEIKTPNFNIKNELRGISFSNINKETDKIFDFKQEHIIRHGFEYSPIDYGNETEESEDYINSLKKSKKIVEEILSVWDKSRNNDVLLYFEFLRTRFPEIEVT